MAAQRVQAYLDKHKIGPLFEDLMAKVIQDMPGNPINYLIRVLQKKEAKMTGKPLANQTATSRPSQTTPSRPSVVKWAQSECVVGKGIATANQRSSKPDTRPLSSKDTSLRKSAGNIRPTSGTTHKPRTTSRSTSLSKPLSQTHLTPSRDIRVVANGEEIPEEELSVVLTSSKKPVASDNEIIPKEASLKRSKKARMNERRKQLASLLYTSTNTGGFQTTALADSDSVEDEGVDLIEDADDLIAEGVSSVSSGNGSRRRQMTTSNVKDQDQRNVKIHICARCARLVNSEEQGQFDTSSLVSITSSRGGYASSTVTLADNERDDFFFTSRTIEDSDDDFESASQISPHTPRMPSWPTSSKGNKSSPAKSSDRGRHMYRRGDSIVNTMLSQSGRPRVGSSQSRDVRSMRSSHEWQVFDNSHIHHPDALPSTAAVAVSTPTVSRRSEEEEEEENGSEETPRLLDQWQTPDGGSDSSALWHSSGGSIQKRFRTRAQLNEMLKTDQSDSDPQMRPLHTRSDRRLSDDEMALKGQGLRGHQFESTDFSRTGDESDEDLSQTHRTYTRSPLGSEL